jgi:hypothetical protein
VNSGDSASESGQEEIRLGAVSPRSSRERARDQIRDSGDTENAEEEGEEEMGRTVTLQRGDASPNVGAGELTLIVGDSGGFGRERNGGRGRNKVRTNSSSKMCRTDLIVSRILGQYQPLRDALLKTTQSAGQAI